MNIVDKFGENMLRGLWFQKNKKQLNRVKHNTDSSI